jgi:hypothetical protein
MDEFFEVEEDDTTIHQTKHLLCDIDDETAPVAVWGSR